MNKILVREILTLNGYDIIEAKDGLEAIKLIAEYKPDLILMDIQLPEMDGFTATRIIKANSLTKDIPVIALTASAMKGDEEMILSSGFDGYMAKPIDVKRLIDLINDTIRGKAAPSS
ncbi:response regulator [bacterium]|nr:MAG: response regulator [bacterium]